MILPDWRIAEELRGGGLQVEPVDLGTQLQPASLDLRLGEEIDDGWAGSVEKHDESVTLWPSRHGNFYLGHTRERVTIPRYLGAKVHGRSSLARKGVAVHITGGWVDPGFDGQLTLEIANFSNRPVQIPVGQRICQLTFHELRDPVAEPYDEQRDSKYVGQTGVTRSRLENYEGRE